MWGISASTAVDCGTWISHILVWKVYRWGLSLARRLTPFSFKCKHMDFLTIQSSITHIKSGHILLNFLGFQCHKCNHSQCVFTSSKPPLTLCIPSFPPLNMFCHVIIISSRCVSHELSAPPIVPMVLMLTQCILLCGNLCPENGCTLGKPILHFRRTIASSYSTY